MKMMEIWRNWRNSRMWKSKSSRLIFNPKDDSLWSEWVDEHSRTHADYRSLVALVHDNEIRRGLRARALVTAILPDAGMRCGFAPFKVPTDLSTYGMEKVDFSRLDDEMRSLAAEAISVCMAQADREHDDLRYYTNLIRSLVAHLPEHEADVLFALHPLNDPFSYWNMDFASGYNPFYSILCDSNLPLRYKRDADTRMRAIVLAEIEGLSKPREVHESAPECYTQHVTLQFYGNRGLAYDASLLENQIDFITRHDETRAGLRLVWWMIARVFDGQQHADLRLRLARTALDDAYIPADAISTVESILAEVGADTTLRQVLEDSLAEAKARAATEAKERSERLARQDSLLAKMKTR